MTHPIFSMVWFSVLSGLPFVLARGRGAGSECPSAKIPYSSTSIQHARAVHD